MFIYVAVFQWPASSHPAIQLLSSSMVCFQLVISKVAMINRFHLYRNLSCTDLQGLWLLQCCPSVWCLCRTYRCGFVFSFPQLCCRLLWHFMIHWDWEILSWGIRDQTFCLCQGDALKQMLGERHALLGGAGGLSPKVRGRGQRAVHRGEGGSSPASQTITPPCLQHHSCHSSREKLWNHKSNQAQKPRGKSQGRKRPCFLWCVIPATSLSHTAYQMFSFHITF